MPNEESKRNIYQRINKVRESNAYIKKEKTVGGDDYGYKAVTHDQVTHELRTDLVTHGIVIEPYLVSERTVQDTLMKMGRKLNPVIRVEGVYDVFFVNIDDPKDRACVRVLAHALDAGDKAPGKLLSYSVKAAMLKMFTIETGEDDEARKEEEAVGDTLPQEMFDGFVRDILALTGKSAEDIDAKAQVLWLKMLEACSKVKDRANATKLRGRLTAKVSELKKGLAK